jgi:FKBP-type peptidyl-prolyl cis-trans isomerase FkpA
MSSFRTFRMMTAALLTSALLFSGARLRAETDTGKSDATTSTTTTTPTPTETKTEDTTVDSDDSEKPKKVVKKKAPKKKASETTVTELQKKDLKVGKGPAAKDGDLLEVNYVGTLTDGKKFDSSYDRKQTFKFRLGKDAVIQGWHKGLVGMKKGGKRRLTIPPDLGYGAAGAGGVIPGNAVLIFEVELVDINPKT